MVFCMLVMRAVSHMYVSPIKNMYIADWRFLLSYEK